MWVLGCQLWSSARAEHAVNMPSLTKTIHVGEAMYPCLVSDRRELQFSLLSTTGDVRYLFLMSFFSSKLWLLFTNWLREFIMSFVVYEHASVEMTNGVSLSSC